MSIFQAMPHFRPDLEGLVTYVPGRPIEDVAREIGMEPDDIVKLASFTAWKKTVPSPALRSKARATWLPRSGPARMSRV
jgi:hypothetical protein